MLEGLRLAVTEVGSKVSLFQMHLVLWWMRECPNIYRWEPEKNAKKEHGPMVGSLALLENWKSFSKLSNLIALK